jgi:uncharacterized protein (TIGR02145 family)
VFKSTCQNINVVTNTPGYSLSVKAGNTTDGNVLIYQNPTTLNPAPRVPATSTGTFASPAILPNDTWGYAIEKQTGMTSINFDTTYTIDNASNKYANLPITDQQLYETDEFPAPINDFKAYYASKLTLNTTAGQYKTQITYTAVGAEVPEVPYLSNVVISNNISTMQGLTDNVCRSVIWDDRYNGANSNNTTVLTDIRNGQDYTVRKMVDGNCWMVDNLKLELGVVDTDPIKDTQILEPNNTNVATNTLVAFNWNVFTENGAAHQGNFVTGGQLTQDGRYYYSYPYPSNEAWRQVDPSSTYECVNNVGYNNSSGMVYNPSSESGCGYLYNYYTATASSNINQAYVTDYSICPTNWRLPRGGEMWSYIDDESVVNPNNEFAVLNAKMANFTGNQTDYYLVSDYYSETIFSVNWSTYGPFRETLASKGRYANLWSSTYRGLTGAGAYAYYHTYSNGDYSYHNVLGPGDESGDLFDNNSFPYGVRCIISS